MRQCSALALECCSEPDERAFRIVFWPDFEADDEPHLEGGGDAAERFGLDCVLPIFDARDGGVARGCPLGDFLLGQAEVAATEHDRAGNRSERSSSLVLSSKLRISPEALLDVVLNGLPDRADPRFVFVRDVAHNAHFIRNGKLGFGSSWRIISCGPRRNSSWCIHPHVEVDPTGAGDFDVAAGYRIRRLPEGMK